jgi:hypothetical protein
MFSSNLIKFSGVFALALVTFSACRFWQNAGGATPTPTPFTAEEIISDIPFSTKEPEVFQVEIVIAANNSENKIFVARNGANRRFDYDAGAKNQVSAIQTDKLYLVIQSRKVYAEGASETASGAESWADFLTNEWLSAKADAKFFKEGAENNLTKYRVVLGEADKSETLVFVDENVNLPVRQEFYSLADGQRVLTMTVELRNLKFEAAPELFSVPKDYKKVSTEEFRTILKKENE